MKCAYNATIVDLSEYIKLDKDWPIRLVQEYDNGKTKYSLQKEANLIKQKYMTQETAAQNKLLFGTYRLSQTEIY